MKHIAIFCDGTWQTLSQAAPTNVAKLARAVRPFRPAEGTRPEIDQVVFYDNGVGVGEGVMNRTTQLVGGAFGAGLNHKIVEAYQFLCLNFEPGDRIFIFGFSRGAYTARSLAGLLRRVWILRREYASKVEDAVALYRNAPPPDAPAAEQQKAAQAQIAFNAAYGHAVTAFTDPRPYDPADPASLQAPDPVGCAWIQYVGVWDTVGSMGIPSALPFAPDFNKKYRWHDTHLSRFVRSARHAVAIDERRDTFAPTLWDNIAGLNDNAGAGALPYPSRPYQQQWFPGVHGSVGGGSGDAGLSATAMLWIATGAARAGLALDLAQIDTSARACAPAAPFDKAGGGIADALMKAIGKKDRAGPTAFDEVSTSARMRWDGVANYRPNTLGAVAGDLNAWPAPAAAPTYFDP